MIEGRVRIGKDVLGNEMKSLMINSNENITHYRSLVSFVSKVQSLG